MIRHAAMVIVSAATLALSGCGQQPSAQATSELEDSALDGAVDIYNGSTVVTIPNPLNRGVKVLHNGARTLEGRAAPFLITEDARAAASNLAFVRDFYNDRFGRFSYDGQGAKIKGVVEVQRFHLLDILGLRENAAWMGAPFNQMVFGAGGNELDGFPQAIDVIGHEFTHAVVHTTSQLGSDGQPGALDEHLADVFGEIIQHELAPESEPFLIGETVLRGPAAAKARALRDMLHPEKSLDPQPATVADIPKELGEGCVPSRTNDACGRHILNSIPNKAAALTIQALGWTDAATLFYTVMTQRLGPTSNFTDYRNAVVKECETMSLGDKCADVVLAFAYVGL